MATHASFTVADSNAANHTFTRVDLDGSHAYYQERASGMSAIEWPTIESSLRNPIPGNGAKVYKGRVKVSLPVVVTETTNGVATKKLARTYTFECTYMLPADGSEDERTLFDSIVRAALGNATLADQNVKLLPLNGN